jgi:cobyric acid synthase
MAAKTLMVQGTGSHVGKSVLVAALCRLFVRRGLRVAPFKAQNMSNNSFVTPDGKEIGRAQAVQAAACRLAPRVEFNPVLIKPEGDLQSQLVVQGKVAGRLQARDFGRVRRDCWEVVQDSFDRLAREFDLVILEGAGSPAEINLTEQDIVNMRMARHARAPVLLVGDIDRGGVFAALVGTLALLDASEREHVKGFVINKFRGDRELLYPGVEMVEAQTHVPCVGILPHWGDLRVPQEDSVGWTDSSFLSLSPHALRLTPHGVPPDASRLTPHEGSLCPSPFIPHSSPVLRIGVADLPAISNFTDFEVLSREPDVRLVRVASAQAHDASGLDALIFPGTKNTAEALKFVRAQGLDQLARRVAGEGGLVLGICGGYQILGRVIQDPHGIESSEKRMSGLGLLDVTTGFARKKVLIQVTGVHRETGCPIEGYQVHMGRTRPGAGVAPLLDVQKPDGSKRWSEGAVSPDGRVIGTYVHGLFDAPLFRRTFLNRLRDRRGWAPLAPQPHATLDDDLDRLADFVASHLNLWMVEAIISKGL